jgi:hypothetical protein
VPDLAFLDVLIGLVVIFLTIALAVTAINQLLAQLFQMRSNALKDGLAQFLDESQDQLKPLIAAANPAAAAAIQASARSPHRLLRAISFRTLFPAVPPKTKAILDHPEIKRLGTNPSYIPPQTLAAAVMDIAAPSPAIAPARNADIDTWKNEFESAAALKRGGPLDPQELQKEIAAAFDATMERVSGWFTRRMQALSFVWAVVLVIALNADAVQFFTQLQSDPSTRQSLVATEIDEGADPDVNALISNLEKAGIQFGWVSPGASDGDTNTVEDRRARPETAAAWTMKVLGLSITILAVTLGAPFWFDLLKHVVQFRAGLSKQTASVS